MLKNLVLQKITKTYYVVRTNFYKSNNIFVYKYTSINLPIPSFRLHQCVQLNSMHILYAGILWKEVYFFSLKNKIYCLVPKMWYLFSEVDIINNIIVLMDKKCSESSNRPAGYYFRSNIGRIRSMVLSHPNCRKKAILFGNIVKIYTFKKSGI